MVNITNMPANFTNFGEMAVWLNTITAETFWTIIAIVMPTIILLILFLRWGTLRAISATSWIMSIVALLLADVGLIDSRAQMILLGIALASTGIMLFGGGKYS